MTHKIEVPDSLTDLLDGPNTAVLTTVGADGLPQSTAVWYLVADDGVLRTSITTDRQKYRNLVRHPKATLFILDPTNPYRTIEIRANVELTPDPTRRWSTSSPTSTACRSRRSCRPAATASSPPSTPSRSTPMADAHLTALRSSVARLHDLAAGLDSTSGDHGPALDLLRQGLPLPVGHHPNRRPTRRWLAR